MTQEESGGSLSKLQKAIMVALKDLERSGVANIDFSAKRRDDESFEDYKIRMKVVKAVQKIIKKGKLVWSPAEIIRVPEMDVAGQPVRDEKGNIKYTDRKIKLGTYETRFGKL